MKKHIFSLTILVLLFFPCSLLAASGGDLSLDQSSVWLSPKSPIDSKPIVVYARVKNNGASDSIGMVSFKLKSTGEKIGSDQPVSVIAGGTDDVFISWNGKHGANEIMVSIQPWDATGDNPNNNSTSIKFTVEQDTDKDTIANKYDPDDDNDGCLDAEDVFPLNRAECRDSDGDGLGDNADEDADNDGCLNTADAFPTDSTECLDNDKDGLGNNKDDDDDGDGISDVEEKILGTDPLKADTDDDQVNDKEDVFPLDPKEAKDSDADGIGNNADTDDDNDVILDQNDEFPYNPAPIIAFNKTQIVAAVNDEITFDASKSYDPKGESVKFLWKIDNQEFTQPKITYIFSKTGQYEGTIKVSDELGQNRVFNFGIIIKDYTLYSWIGVSIIILLAIIIILKYISKAQDKQGNKNNQETKFSETEKNEKTGTNVKKTKKSFSGFKKRKLKK